jgi:hypothetical protein
MELQRRQWSGGKLLHGIIARILLCCVGVTDGMTDMTSDYSKSLVLTAHAHHFLLACRIPLCSCAPGAHEQSIQMRGQKFR